MYLRQKEPKESNEATSSCARRSTTIVLMAPNEHGCGEIGYRDWCTSEGKIEGMKVCKTGRVCSGRSYMSVGQP